MTSLLYVVHDLSDAAVNKRKLMFESNRVSVHVAGFLRGKKCNDGLGQKTTVVGKTFDGKFFNRLLSIVGATFRIRDLIKKNSFEVLVARNLEQLFAANIAMVFLKERPRRVVYECLDVHRFLIDEGWKGKFLRKIEAICSKNVDLLLTSSPGFIQNYFAGSALAEKAILLVENKVFPSLEVDALVRHEARSRREVHIGWFGNLRCSKSLAILDEVSAALRGQLKVTIRGKPALNELPDFDAVVEENPHIDFFGPYKSPDDLSTIYSGIDLIWAVDFFEEGGNSEWLLPNRIYEGGRFSCIPVVRADTQTAVWCRQKGIGVELDAPYNSSLVSLVKGLDDDRLMKMQEASKMCSIKCFEASPEEVEAIVETIILGIPENKDATHEFLTFFAAGELHFRNAANEL